MVAAKIAKLPRGANQHVEISTPTQSAAASLLNVSRESVIAARRVEEKGIPELAAAVESDRVSVSASLRGDPPARRRSVLGSFHEPSQSVKR